jgi:hypothetical protein
MQKEIAHGTHRTRGKIFDPEISVRCFLFGVFRVFRGQSQFVDRITTASSRTTFERIMDFVETSSAHLSLTARLKTWGWPLKWWWALAILSGGGTQVTAAEQLTASFDPATRHIEIAASGLVGTSYELRIDTAGIREVELGRDVNEPGIIYLPPREGPISLIARPRDVNTAEAVFFFNDLVNADGWELLFRFPTGARGTWKLNGRFSKLGGALTDDISIPASALERGENLLYFESAVLTPPKLSFRRTLPAGAAFSCGVTAASPGWSGRVLLMRRGADGESVVLADVALVGRAATRRPSASATQWWQNRAAVADAAIATGRNLLSAQIADSRSFFHGGFNLVYDPQRGSPRISHWIWSWGPSIALLLELEKLPAAQKAGLSPAFRTAAIAAGRRSLAFEVTGPQHPAAGVSTVRWEPSRAVPGGWVEYISTADSLFLAGWGWMALHGATGESEFLRRTESLVAAAERLMEQYPVVPQDWVVQRQRWTPHTLDESVFGMVGFRTLYAATKSPTVAAAGKRFLDSHLARMSRGSGLLERAWMREENRAIWDPDIKGHAWVVEGYLDAHQLSGDAKCLELARALTARVLDCQGEDGAWTYLFRKPAGDDPRDDKGTAIWAYMLYQVHRVTNDPAHRAAARRAVGWCLQHQYRGDDPHLEGGLLHVNAMAYVRRRPMTILYSTTFFGLALLEELALDDSKVRSGSARD